jgi:hypothetical protein
MRTRLELGTSGSIDLLDNIPYSLNYAIADIREPDKRNSSYSKTIKIPGSKSNNIIFAHIFEINIQSNFNANLKTPCRLYVDELLQMQGFLQLLKINKTDDNQIEYEVAIKGNVGNIFTDWADLQLTDLDLSAYNHTYDKTAQKASWVATYGEGYVYPMIDYCIVNGSNGLTFDVENFYPAIYVKQYIDSMFTKAGYTYSSAFFDSAFFKRLIIPFNATTLLLSEAELTSRYFKANRSANYIGKTLTSTAASQFLAYTTSAPVKIQINTDVSDVSNQFNTTTFEATIAEKGSYIFTSSISFNLSFSGLTTSPSTLPFDFNVYFIIGIFDSSGVLVTTLGTGYYIVPSQVITNGGTSSTYVMLFSTQTVTILAGQKLCVSFSLDSIVLNQAGVINLNILAGSYFENKAINTGIFDGDSLVMNDMAIPRNIKIKDFFTSIIKMFNLYIETDKTIANKLYIEPRNDFYSVGVTKDWTDKLSIDRVMDIDPMGELNASRYTFKYKEDKDYYNQKYQNGFLEPYGTMNKDIDTDFIKGTKTIDIIFSPTPLSKTGTTDRIISQISTLGNDGLGLTNIKNCNLRILYFDLKNTNDSWTYTGSVSGTTTETTYPYAGHVDTPLLPTFDLNFGVPQDIYYITTAYTNNNLYNKFYKKYIEEITDKDSKIITAYFYLTPLDIYLLDFRNQFFVDGNLLRLNKIYDYNPLSNELTKCEFIKIKEALAFVAELGVAVGVIGPAYDTGDNVPILVDTATVGPIGTFVGNGSVVDTTVVNSVVLGTGNYVGAGSGNVGIFGSSGVTVFPGVLDVFVLNSNNVVVTESNISIVNGVFLPSGSQSEQGITAYAGGGQTNGYQTTKKFNLIETVATTADSIKTILATLNAEQTFKNVGANSMTVYPRLGEQFRRGTTLLGANVGYAVASRNSLHIYCYEEGVWTD